MAARATRGKVTCPHQIAHVEFIKGLWAAVETSLREHFVDTLIEEHKEEVARPEAPGYSRTTVALIQAMNKPR